MSFLLNELSLHGQFNDIASFEKALSTVMEIRKLIKQQGHKLVCSRNLLQRDILSHPKHQLSQLANRLDQNRRRALMSWITREGPFWEARRQHSEDDYFEYDDEIVTDSALGEAAWLCANGNECSLVSFMPSDWYHSPLSIEWHLPTEDIQTIDIHNYWEIDQIRNVLTTLLEPLSSWRDLQQRAVSHCNNLTFSEQAFNPLQAQPFVLGAANRLLFLLEKLNQFATCFDENGQRNEEGNKIYQDFFTGKKGQGGHGAPFSDSSEDEKRRFKKQLTFKNPQKNNSELFCPMHGKTQTPQLRFHFSWPINVNEPVYIVYVGPKLTKH